MSGSIQKALSGTSLPHDQMLQEYSPFISLTTRILGAPPKFLSLAHASPLTHIFYLGALRPCFHIPECDLSLLPITASIRRTTLLESSIAHQCVYCTGHVLAMGDVVNGPMVAQCARRGDMQQAAAKGDDVVTRLVKEACAFPASLAHETKAEFVKIYGENGYAQMASMLAFMGWLNFTMGAAGMRLESRMVPFAEAATKNRNLPFGFRNTMNDDKEEDIGVSEVSNVRARGFWGLLVDHVRNAWGLVALLGPVASAGMAERKWFSGIPNSAEELDQWCVNTVGSDLKVFHGVKDVTIKRCLALGLRLVFIEEDPLWTREQKCMFMYTLGAGIMDERLKDDALKLLNVTRKNADEEAAAALSMARSANEPRNAFEAGLRFMHVCAGHADNVPEDVVEGLVEHVKEHRSIVDLVGMVGQFGFWHRISVLYPGKH